MRLTTKGRYAVVAMAEIASQRGGRPVPLADIADRRAISLPYLEQLFSKLRRAGLVCSVRGPGGGYRLAQPAEDIAIAAIVLAVDENLGLDDAGEAIEAGELGCPFKRLWQSLSDHVRDFLGSVKLADLVEPCSGASVTLSTKTIDARAKSPIEV